jgi:hypothetical protein
VADIDEKCWILVGKNDKNVHKFALPQGDILVIRLPDMLGDVENDQALIEYSGSGPLLFQYVFKLKYTIAGKGRELAVSAYFQMADHEPLYNDITSGKDPDTYWYNYGYELTGNTALEPERTEDEQKKVDEISTNNAELRQLNPEVAFDDAVIFDVAPNRISYLADTVKARLAYARSKAPVKSTETVMPLVNTDREDTSTDKAVMDVANKSVSEMSFADAYRYLQNYYNAKYLFDKKLASIFAENDRSPLAESFMVAALTERINSEPVGVGTAFPLGIIPVTQGESYFHNSVVSFRSMDGIKSGVVQSTLNYGSLFNVLLDNGISIRVSADDVVSIEKLVTEGTLATVTENNIESTKDTGQVRTPQVRTTKEFNATREGQMRMANRGATVAALLALNAQLAALDPSSAFSETLITQEGADLDWLRDELSKKFVTLSRIKSNYPLSGKSIYEDQYRSFIAQRHSLTQYLETELGKPLSLKQTVTGQSASAVGSVRDTIECLVTRGLQMHLEKDKVTLVQQENSVSKPDVTETGSPVGFDPTILQN